MAIYQYVALNERGRKIKGSMTASNELDLEERLSALHLDILTSREARSQKPSIFSKVTLKDKILFCIHLEQLERAGVPLLESISDMRDTTESPIMKNIMSDIYESIKNGKILSEALNQHPKIFGKVFISLVSAGEKSGNIGEIFKDLANHLKWVSLINKKIKKAVTYPTFLLLMMFGIVALMMLHVIPKLSSFLESQSFGLPFYTKALIATSYFFKDYWLYIFLAPIITFITIKILKTISEGFAYKLDAFKLRIPYVGTTIVKIELARFCHFFGIMFRSGIGILECLDVATNVISNKVIAENAAVIKSSVTEGNSLTDSLKVSSRFPNLVIRMFKVGEDSGNLNESIENINFFYDKEVEDSVSNMVGVIQPLLTIIMGLIMGWVTISVFGPLYNSFSNMNF